MMNQVMEQGPEMGPTARCLLRETPKPPRVDPLDLRAIVTTAITKLRLRTKVPLASLSSGHLAELLQFNAGGPLKVSYDPTTDTLICWVGSQTIHLDPVTDVIEGDPTSLFN